MQNKSSRNSKFTLPIHSVLELQQKLLIILVCSSDQSFQQILLLLIPEVLNIDFLVLPACNSSQYPLPDPVVRWQLLKSSPFQSLFVIFISSRLREDFCTCIPPHSRGIPAPPQTCDSIEITSIHCALNWKFSKTQQTPERILQFWFKKPWLPMSRVWKNSQPKMGFLHRKNPGKPQKVFRIIRPAHLKSQFLGGFKTERMRLLCSFFPFFFFFSLLSLNREKQRSLGRSLCGEIFGDVFI